MQFPFSRFKPTSVLPRLCPRLPPKKRKNTVTQGLCCFLPSLLTYSIITLLRLTSSESLLSLLLADNCLQLGLISSLCAPFEWHKPNSMFVCIGWRAGTHSTCQHGQNRICSKLIMSRLCSLWLPFFLVYEHVCVCVASEYLGLPQQDSGRLLNWGAHLFFLNIYYYFSFNKSFMKTLQ